MFYMYISHNRGLKERHPSGVSGLGPADVQHSRPARHPRIPASWAETHDGGGALPSAESFRRTYVREVLRASKLVETKTSVCKDGYAVVLEAFISLPLGWTISTTCQSTRLTTTGYIYSTMA